MTRKQALEALAAMGIAGKIAEFLLDGAEKHGGGAHLHAEVTYAPGLGFVIVGYPENDGEGTWVTPGTASG